MWCTLFYAFLVVAAAISASRAQESNDPACATHATVPFPKTLRCPCSSEDKVSVTWCLTCPLGGSSVCLNSTSVTSVFGDCPRSYASGQLYISQYPGYISFRNDTSLYLSRVDLTYQYTTFNCTCQCSNGSKCGAKNNFRLTFDNPGLLTFSTPMADGTGLQAMSGMIYGTTQILCISGTSNGYTNTTWIINSTLSIPAQDVTGAITCNIRNCQPTCLQAFSQLYSKANSLTDHYTGYLIMPFYQSCSQARVDFVSVLFIDQLSIGDEGMYSFYIVSSDGYAIPNNNNILVSPAYGFINPNFHCTGGSECPRNGSNIIYTCNVTLTYNASVQWFYQPSNSTLPPVPIPFIQYDGLTNPGGGGKPQLANLCRVSGGNSTFALSLGQMAVPYDGVTAKLHSSALVVCEVIETSYGYYYAQVGSVIGPRCRATSSPTSPTSPETSAGLVAVGVFMTLALLIMLVVTLVCGHQCWVRRKAVNIMAPISIHMRPLLLHQASELLGSPIDERGLLSTLQTPRDQWEFPRVNLEFVALLGEGQFGQVWKAQATGICSEEGRNVVAVKTVKSHASPVDVDELYAELEIMKHIEPHPNILNLLGQCSQTDTQPLCILMEFACYGSLKDYLQRCGEHIRQRSSAARASSEDTLTPPILPLPTHHVCNYHHLVLNHLNDYLTKAAIRESWHDYLPMKSLGDEEGEEKGRNRGGGIEPGKREGPSCLPGGGGGFKGAGQEGVSPYQEAWRLSATNRLATPDPGLQSTSNRSSYVYPQEQSSGFGGGGRGPSLGDLRDSGGRPQQPSEQQGMSLGDQCAGESGMQQLHLVGGQRGASPLGGCQAATGQWGASPACPPVVTGGQRGVSPACQASGGAGGQQLEVPRDPQGGRQGETPFSSPFFPSLDCVYCSQAEHYRNLDRGEGFTPEGKLADMAEPVELMASDILNFALQIARGMEHLESMKYVHRDLAARNVLIAEGFLLKIGDFGLTRDLSEREYYKKITAGKLPARWMAIESLLSRRHTYKSDVWSFAVVLWEMFTYGAIPYGRLPAANSCESLANYLKRGERLTQPPNCSDDFYQLMLRCWNENMDLRPSFSDLKRIFDDLLSSTHGYLRMVSDTANEPRPVAHEIQAPFIEPQQKEEQQSQLQKQSHTSVVFGIDPEPPLIKCAPISTLSPMGEDCSPQQGGRAYVVTRPAVPSCSLDFKETVL